MMELIAVYENIIDRLNHYAREQAMDEYTRLMIIDMSKKVLEHLAKKYSNVRKGVGVIMGGKILDYEAKDILNKGKRQHLVMQVQKKIERGDSLEKIADDLVEDVEVIKGIVNELHT